MSQASVAAEVAPPTTRRWWARAAMALAVAWLGAAAGRAVSAALDGEAGRYNSGAMVFNALIGVTLSLPFFNIGRVVLDGARLA